MMTSFLNPQRKCGECRACCTAIAVKELRKPFMAHCEHECDKGCAIYKTKPDSCSGYECGWLLGMGHIEDRPDRIGGVIHHETDEHGLWVQVHLLRKVNPGEFKLLMMTAELCFKITSARGIKLVHHDIVQNCNFPPDLTKYPGTENTPDKVVWETRDDIHYILRGTKRIPLKVV